MASHERPYADTARALASQIDDDEPLSHSRSSNSPSWRRRSNSQPASSLPKWRQSAESFRRRTIKIWSRFTPWQQAGLSFLSVLLLLGIVLGLVYNERIFAWLAPGAKKWREMRGGWLILWAMTFAVSFPPLIGYSTCVTIAGFVFGMKGWFIVSTATVLGSTVAFIASRSVLKGFVSRMAEKNQRFAALSLVLKHDGLKLLIMIRLCPLPYSFSNGAISTIPTVTWQNFALATGIVSPKLLLHVFVGSRLGALAENGDKMDSRTKMVSYISILIGMTAGLATGYFIYIRTKARAKQLEAEEAAAAGGIGGRRTPNSGDGYNDEEDEQEAVEALRGSRDDVSLHTTRDQDLERGRAYQDDFTDDEDAQERDVFDDGDGDDDEIWKGARR
ncbi:Tlg2-vesicle protein [Teratosphaeriaceae sp. CCFEE 6253]|nr:Tlg2-vesicle protein [Teratosphaeriaceae sp. CCFEE 6253]